MMTLRELLKDILISYGGVAISDITLDEVAEQIEDMVDDWYKSHYVLIGKSQEMQDNKNA